MSSGANLRYIFSDALRSTRENMLTTALTAFTIGFSLAIFALFLFVSINLNGVISTWGDKTRVVVYVKDNAGLDMEKFEEGLRRVQGVTSFVYISREAALKELKNELKGHESILEGVDKNLLPASFEIKLGSAYRDSGKVRGVAENLKKLPWADEVQYSQEWVEKFASLIRFIELVALVIGVFLAAATVFIVSNTVRLAVYARREEIEIMRLIGASDMYVKVPFFIEGVMQGVLGGLISFVILTAGRYLILDNVPQYFWFALNAPFQAPVVFSALVLTGIFMGVAGSLITVGRFLKV